MPSLISILKIRSEILPVALQDGYHYPYFIENDLRLREVPHGSVSLSTNHMHLVFSTLPLFSGWFFYECSLKTHQVVLS